MAEQYILEDRKTLEEERARITQNLSVIVHELYFQTKYGIAIDVDNCADQIAETVKFINYLYEKVSGSSLEEED